MASLDHGALDKNILLCMVQRVRPPAFLDAKFSGARHCAMFVVSGFPLGLLLWSAASRLVFRRVVAQCLKNQHVNVGMSIYATCVELSQSLGLVARELASTLPFRFGHAKGRRSTGHSRICWSDGGPRDGDFAGATAAGGGAL